MAPLADVDEDEDAAVPQAEDEEDEDQAVVHPKPATNKTLWVMWQLATFYNPAATNYIQAMDSNDDTITTSNQLGREGADAANPDPDDDDSDASLKRHVLQEDGSNTSSKWHDLKEDVSLKHASAAIDYLPNFAFYTRNQVLASARKTKSLDFKDTFEHHMLEPTTFQEAYNHEDPEQRAKWRATIQKAFKDMNNCGMWCKVKQSVIPSGKCCIKSKWLFKIKRDGMFQAKLVAWGYSQIPGIDFTKTMCPWWMTLPGISC